MYDISSLRVKVISVYRYKVDPCFGTGIKHSRPHFPLPPLGSLASWRT